MSDNFMEQTVDGDLEAVSCGDAQGIPIDPWLTIRRVHLDGDREHRPECDCIPDDQVLSLSLTPAMRSFLRSFLNRLDNLDAQGTLI